MKKVAVITGSTSGIGLGMAEAFAHHGYDLGLHGLGDESEIKALIMYFESKYKIKTFYSNVNLATAKLGQQLIQDVEKGLGRIDVLINNAGVQHVAPLESFSDEQWDLILAVNLSAAFHTTKAVLPGMRQRKFGRIINIASAHGLVASVQKAAYVAAKHGLVGLTKVTALETAGSGITCNAICPGWVKTPLVTKQIEARAKVNNISIEAAEHALLFEKQPSGQFVTPEQLADFALFLSSDAAQGMTGSSLAVDGGWTAQ